MPCCRVIDSSSCSGAVPSPQDEPNMDHFILPTQSAPPSGKRLMKFYLNSPERGTSLFSGLREKKILHEGPAWRCSHTSHTCSPSSRNISASGLSSFSHCVKSSFLSSDEQNGFFFIAQRKDFQKTQGEAAPLSPRKNLVAEQSIQLQGFP